MYSNRDWEAARALFNKGVPMAGDIAQAIADERLAVLRKLEKSLVLLISATHGRAETPSAAFKQVLVELRMLRGDES